MKVGETGTGVRQVCFTEEGVIRSWSIRERESQGREEALCSVASLALGRKAKDVRKEWLHHCLWEARLFLKTRI